MTTAVVDTQSPYERLARSLAGVVAAGALLGLLIGGVCGRLAMFMLARLSPEAEGVESDDGFVMGQFTLSGSLNLLLVGTVIGTIGGGIYFVLRSLMIGPRWFQILSIAGGAAVVAGSGLVHSDGVDFTLLHPALLAIVVFIAIPGLYAALLTVVAERWIAPDGIFSTGSNRIVTLPLLLCIPLAPLFIPIAAAWAIGIQVPAIVSFLSQPWVRWIPRLVLTAIFVLAGADLVSDINALV